MGCNEPLGQPPTSRETIDVEAKAATPTAPVDTDNKPSGQGLSGSKRKRSSTDESSILTGLTDAVWGFAAAITEAAHAEAAPGIYQAVMGCANFTRESLMFALNHLMENKASALIFVGMVAEDKDLWLRTYLVQHYYD